MDIRVFIRQTLTESYKNAEHSYIKYLFDKAQKFAKWSAGGVPVTKANVIEFLQNTDEDKSNDEKLISDLVEYMNDYDKMSDMKEVGLEKTKHNGLKLVNEGVEFDVLKEYPGLEKIFERGTYEEGAISAVKRIVEDVNHISEKAFKLLDKSWQDVNNIVKEHKEEISKKIKEYKAAGKREEYCAEALYDVYFKDLTYDAGKFYDELSRKDALNENMAVDSGIMYFDSLPFSVNFKNQSGENKINFVPLNISTLNRVSAMGKTIVADKIRNQLVTMGVKNPVYNGNDNPAVVTFVTDGDYSNILKPGGDPHNMKYDFSLNEIKKK